MPACLPDFDTLVPMLTATLCVLGTAGRCGRGRATWSVVQVKLLTELHWALPHPLSDAENVLKQQELPRLVAEIRQLTVTIKVCWLRSGLIGVSHIRLLLVGGMRDALLCLQGLGSRAEASKGAGGGRPHTPELAVPAGQVRSLRAALAEQADLIATAQTLADFLEQQAVQIEES